jgi:hypothetical protein
VEAFGILHVLQKRLHLNLSLLEGSILRQRDLFAFPDLFISTCMEIISYLVDWGITPNIAG